MQNPNTTIIVDYYQGAYGPTIRIDIHSIDEIIRIRNVINNIKDGKMEQFRFRSFKNTKITGFNDLIMKKIETRKRFYYQSIRKVENTDIGPVFLWLQTADGWEHSEGLIDGLIESGGPGHQYLTDEKDVVLIELAYME